MISVPIKTSTWFAKMPPGHTRIGVSRGAPREISSYKCLRALEPGPWFNRVSVAEYLERYNAILSELDPGEIANALVLGAEGAVPVMDCYESALKVQTGELWCHRHLVAQWLEDRLGLVVEEVGYEGRPFDRFRKLTLINIQPPSYERTL